ncbi:MAG: cysteine-rich KTR domain-containing protein [Oscillospiraceae bacterium]|nr:cysteine-rich KTR domain-containing protein [Oscillospiraceae bacterium]
MELTGELENDKISIMPDLQRQTPDKDVPDTVLTSFPLFCPQCKWETIIRLNGRDKHAKICNGEKYGAKEWEVKR